MSEVSLKNKTIKGVGWSAVDNLSSHLVSFVVGIVLARLLSPSDYGLLGIIGIFTSVCTAVINSGFAGAIIRKAKPTEEDYNTAFIINFGLSIILYIVIFLSAPLIADFFEREELVLLTRVSSITMVVGAFSMVQQTRLTKRIDFKSQTKITIISSIVSGVVGVAMAFLNCGVWALVAQGIIGQLIRTVLLIVYNKWLPALSFSKASFTSLFDYGWKMMVSNVLDSVWTQLNQVIIGKFYKPATLGQYTRATGFSQLFSTNLTNVIQRVTLPVLSNIQEDETRMVNGYRRIIKLTMYVTFICMFALGAVSEPLIFCLIGSKWYEASTYLPIICVMGAFYPLHAINLNMLQIQGRSDIFLILDIIKKVLYLGPMFVGAFVGIMPMLYASLGTNIICYFLNSFYTGRKLGYSSWMQIKDISLSFLIAIIMAVVVYFIKFIPLTYWIILPIQLISVVAIVVVLSRLFRSCEYVELMQIIRPAIQRIKRK